MKKIGKIIIDVIITLWFFVAVFVSVCLLSYNDYKTTVLGNNTLVIVDNDELEPDYKEGDLVVVKRNSDKNINNGDKVFYYNSSKTSTVFILTGEVTDKETVSNFETTYTINENKVSGEFVIGKFETAKVFKGLGVVLGILTSKWGFLFLIILPTLFAIVYEIMMIIAAVKESKQANEKKTDSN